MVVVIRSDDWSLINNLDEMPRHKLTPLNHVHPIVDEAPWLSHITWEEEVSRTYCRSIFIERSRCSHTSIGVHRGRLNLSCYNSSNERLRSPSLQKMNRQSHSLHKMNRRWIVMHHVAHGFKWRSMMSIKSRRSNASRDATSLVINIKNIIPHLKNGKNLCK